MTVVDLETFEVTFAEIIDSCTVNGFADFICVFEEEGAEFTFDCTTNWRM
jgi:hypothetical protein